MIDVHSLPGNVKDALPSEHGRFLFAKAKAANT